MEGLKERLRGRVNERHDSVGHCLTVFVVLVIIKHTRKLIKRTKINQHHVSISMLFIDYGM